MKAVTIRDVAAEARVSIKTVSRVINGEKHVRAELRERVEDVVARLGYRPNTFARSLSGSRSYLVGLFVDNPSSSYAADVQLGALTRCRERSYHLVIEPVDLAAPDWAEAMADGIRALRLDGAVLIPPLCDEPAAIAVLEAAGLPYVRISPHEEQGRSGVVAMDDFAAAQEMTAHLIGLGHRDIGFIKGPPLHRVSETRLAGFMATMAEAGLSVPEHRVMTGDFAMRSGLDIGEAMLGGGASGGTGGRPSAIFASNDDMALGVLITALKHGIAVPEQLSIAGFDDAPISRAAWPAITTIRQPMAAMAAAAIDMLIDPAFRGREDDAAYHRSLAYALVVRGSTGPV